jgi:hypothetical protein
LSTMWILTRVVAGSSPTVKARTLRSVLDLMAYSRLTWVSEPESWAQ